MGNRGEDIRELLKFLQSRVLRTCQVNLIFFKSCNIFLAQKKEFNGAFPGFGPRRNREETEIKNALQVLFFRSFKFKLTISRTKTLK